MATWYVDSAISSGNDGVAWSTAWAHVGDGTYAPGDRVYVTSTHAESETTSSTLTSSSDDPDNPIVFLSATDPGSDIAPTAFARSAGITVTSTGDIIFNFANQSAVFIGFDFTSGDNMSTQSDSRINFIDCTFTLTGTSATDFISTSENSLLSYEKCTFAWGSTSQGFNMSRGSVVRMVDCSEAGATHPTTLFEFTSDGDRVYLSGCDFSSSTNLLGDASGNPSSGIFYAEGERCKLPTNVFSATPANFHSRADFYGSDTGTLHYGIHIEDSMGKTNEDGAIYRDAKWDGTTGYSFITVSTAKGVPGMFAHRYHLCDIWIDTDDTVDIEFTTPQADTADTSEIWAELVKTDATGPLGSHQSTVDSDYGLGTPTALSAGDSGAGDWTGEAASANFYKLEVTAGGAAGRHSIYINIATASVKTFNVDPFVDVTAA